MPHCGPATLTLLEMNLVHVLALLEATLLVSATSARYSVNRLETGSRDLIGPVVSASNTASVLLV